MISLCRFLLPLFSLLFSGLAVAGPLGIQREVFPAAGSSHYLVVEILSDSLAHFELSGYGGPPGRSRPIYVSPMVDRAHYGDYHGPTFYRRQGNQIETVGMRLRIETDQNGDRCVRMEDKALSVYLTRICGKDLGNPQYQRLDIDRGQMQNAYGIGNLFVDPTTADGDWTGRSWRGRNHGNFRFGPHWFNGKDAGSDDFDGGGPSVSQFPILYATGSPIGEDTFQNYALFLDHVYLLSWNFDQGDTWTAQSYGDQLRWFFFTGANLRQLRGAYLNLVGRPPLPPKNAFGLWISKFGYDSWTEIRNDLESLRGHHFPVDGVALDLQWFGGSFLTDDDIAAGRENRPRMGALGFNENAFPRPQTEVPFFRERYGIRFMPIEESYVDNRLPEFHEMSFDAKHCYLASISPDICQPIDVQRNINSEKDAFVWWGKGGMIDWTNPAGALHWHNEKRMSLARLGIYSHWLDLGEPEMYYQYAYYHGLGEPGKRQHGDVHNLYNLMWAKSIDDGYRDARNQAELARLLSRDMDKEWQLDGAILPYGPRHFTMSRAGTVGSQRYGAMWSGDVGRNSGNLRAHLNTQLHMSLAGMDYYGSDAGGFLGTGQGLEPGFNESELYTQWFADNSLTDVPLRPHGWALDKSLHFTPDQKGDLQSNFFHLRQRYELTPYIYSLAHRAYLYGEPIFPPPLYYFQDDPQLRIMGNEKMIGHDLLFGAVAGIGQQGRPLYLPRGRWANYHQPEQWCESRGEWMPELPLHVDYQGKSIFRLPLFARAGAIIPKMYIDDRTRNVSGRRAADEGSVGSVEKEIDEQLRDELILRVYADETRSKFSLYEDDGLTLGYEHGQVRVTPLAQHLDGLVETIEVGAATGPSFPGAVLRRSTVIELVAQDRLADTNGVVGPDGEILPYCTGGETQFDTGVFCWFSPSPNFIKVRFKPREVRQAQTFTFRLIPGSGTTPLCGGAADRG